MVGFCDGFGLYKRFLSLLGLYFTNLCVNKRKQIYIFDKDTCTLCVCVCLQKKTYYFAGRCQVTEKCSKVKLCLWSEDYSIKITPCTYALLLQYLLKLLTRPRDQVWMSISALNPITWKIWWAPNNASRLQMGFNSALKGLKHHWVIQSSV